LLLEQNLHAPEEGVMILSYIEAKIDPKEFLQIDSDFITNHPFIYDAKNNGYVVEPYKNEFLA
jgi:hypothetical protein